MAESDAPQQRDEKLESCIGALSPADIEYGLFERFERFGQTPFRSQEFWKGMRVLCCLSLSRQSDSHTIFSAWWGGNFSVFGLVMISTAISSHWAY
jgi:hypothetical protein